MNTSSRATLLFSSLLGLTTAAGACGSSSPATTAGSGATSHATSGSHGSTTQGAGGQSAATQGSGGATTQGTGGQGTGGQGTGGSAGAGGGSPAGSVVFLILMENHNWSDIKGSASAPYINGTLLPKASHAEQYFNPPGNHPSEPNYVWLEAGSNLGITDDSDPSSNSQSTTAHLVNQLEAAGLTWKAYEEDISGADCPLVGVANYAPKHDPMVFFRDVTANNSPTAPRCIAHIRPFTELATDLASGKVANYNFLTPNLCDDMHDTCAPQNDSVKQGDDWLAMVVPQLLASSAYAKGAVVLITWDESELGDFPIGMLALSASAKGAGYSNTTHYTHSSTLRTVQEIFGLSPFLGDAVTATDLSDLFTKLP